MNGEHTNATEDRTRLSQERSDILEDAFTQRARKAEHFLETSISENEMSEPKIGYLFGLPNNAADLRQGNTRKN